MAGAISLTSSVERLKGVGTKKKAELSRLGIKTIYDLVTYFPRCYENQSTITNISNLQVDGKANITGIIINFSERLARRRNLKIFMALVGDGTGFIELTWFNQPFLKKQLKVGNRLFASGKVSYAYGGKGQLAMHPSSFQLLENNELPTDKAGIVPLYKATEKINQKFFYTVLANLWSEGIEIPELIPEDIKKSYKLLPRKTALKNIHNPNDLDELKAARYTLAFNELYIIQCGLMLLKKQAQSQNKGIKHLKNNELITRLLHKLPFKLTNDQAKVWQDISRDMESLVPMRRLVQGDVGSGKTVIAMLALVKTVASGYQGAFMAPTDILASQHYESFSKLLEPIGIRVGFLSGKLTPKRRQEMQLKIASQEVDIVIGTHALIQKAVHFKKLGLAITDEQHRFGIAQRAELEKKTELMPDVLVMTATPIPRTMTLTVYGDLDVSIIEHLPPGRQPVRTFLRQPDRRNLIYKYVRQQIESGRQAYVVCPLIEQNEDSELPSATEIFEELRAGIFYDIPCALMHGRLKSAEKDAIMQDFYNNKIKLLVATTVIEVGVNVPNASIMVIENAERFGLSQLHQLRGRIGRGEYQSYCIMVSEQKTDSARERLNIMVNTTDGFKLAEEDLKLRGPGQFFGAMQHGLPDLKIANVLKDTAILLKARKAAAETLNNNYRLDGIIKVLAEEYQQEFGHINEI